jgi:hypothetical protein
MPDYTVMPRYYLLDIVQWNFSGRLNLTLLIRECFRSWSSLHHEKGVRYVGLLIFEDNNNSLGVRCGSESSITPQLR